MCGISLIYAWDSRSPLAQISEMGRLIRHRGPDDEGYAFFRINEHKGSLILGGEDTPQAVYRSSSRYAPKGQFSREFNVSAFQLAMGHRRLSILDLSEQGHQPMCDLSERFWLTYNGEIYNYQEIKVQLENLGHTFRTHTDTEVVLLSYKEWGANCLHRFNGMFGFALYDALKKELFVARDRFAEKPVYFWVSPCGFLAVGSEIKQFSCLHGWKAVLNKQTIGRFLVEGILDYSEETCFEGVYQLKGGTYFLATIDGVNKPEIRVQRWYEVPKKPFKGSFNEAVESFGELLKDSIALRLRADVPVGSCLSGGLDSSSVVCTLHQLLSQQTHANPQKTFSACSLYKRFDESEFIEAVIEKTQLENHTTFPKFETLIDELPALIWHHDEPFGSTSIFAQWEVFKSVKSNGIKVVLDGQGADEILGGYSAFYHYWLLDLVRSRKWKKFVQERYWIRHFYGIDISNKVALKAIIPQWFKKTLWGSKPIKRAAQPWLDHRQLPLDYTSNRQHPYLGQFEHHCFEQTSTTSLPMLLHFEDRDSMAHSIEGRTPFLDYRLVELSLSLPSEFKINQGISKFVLREAMKGVLPDKIRWRTSKLGFATPEEIWVRQHSPDIFRGFVKESIRISEGMITPKAIDLAEDMIQGKIKYDSLLWRIIIVGKWMERFNVAAAGNTDA